jgi:hypothetical protein
MSPHSTNSLHIAAKLQVNRRCNHKLTVLAYPMLGCKLKLNGGLRLHIIIRHGLQTDSGEGARSWSVGDALVGLGNERTAFVEDLNLEGL